MSFAFNTLQSLKNQFARTGNDLTKTYRSFIERRADLDQYQKAQKQDSHASNALLAHLNCMDQDGIISSARAVAEARAAHGIVTPASNPKP
jgi:hypothetical protein